MVIIALEKAGKKCLLIGLSKGNIDTLLCNDAVVADHENHKESLLPLGLGQVVIVPCETESDLLAILFSKHPNAPGRIHPDLNS